MKLKRVFIGLVMLAVFVGLVWYGFVYKGSSSDHHRGHHSYGQSGAGLPVLTARATTENVPITLSGVGTIQAFQTVTVEPQVTGKLVSVNFKEGQEVKKGALLAKIDPVTFKADLDEARAKLAHDEATLENDRLNLKRYAKLAKTNYVSQQQADQARATVQQDEAQVQSDKAAMDSAAATLGYTSIDAPIQGRTGLRQVDEGNIVTANSTAIVTITQIQPITAIFTLPSDEVDRVTRAVAASQNPLTVTVSGPQSSATLDTGQLTVINNEVDSETGTIKLKAVFPNKKELLWPGQFVNARLQIGTRQDATVIPIAALQQGPNNAFVYLIGPDDKAKMTPVTVLQQNAHIAVIGKGIRPGQAVITTGFGELTDGTKVQLPGAHQPSAHSQAGHDRHHGARDANSH